MYPTYQDCNGSPDQCVLYDVGSVQGEQRVRQKALEPYHETSEEGETPGLTVNTTDRFDKLQRTWSQMKVTKMKMTEVVKYFL